MSPYMAFETSRLSLRPLTYDDAQHILALNLDPDWQKYIGDRGVYDLDSARRYIKNGPMRMYQQQGFGVLAVIEKDSDEFVGTCGLLKRESLGAPDIGFAFFPAARGKGYAFEAAQGLLSQVRMAAKWTFIEALVSTDNQASIGLLNKLGFVFMQPLANFEPDKDTHLYRCTI